MFRARPEETPAPVTETRETAEERESQCALILDVLKEGVSLTQSEAIYLFNCYRLSARIWDLREDLPEVVPEEARLHPGRA